MQPVPVLPYATRRPPLPVLPRAKWAFRWTLAAWILPPIVVVRSGAIINGVDNGVSRSWMPWEMQLVLTLVALWVTITAFRIAARHPRHCRTGWRGPASAVLVAAKLALLIAAA